MTQKDKELLLKDLCARLTCEAKVDHFGTVKELLGIMPSSEIVMVGYDINDYEDSVIEDIKPYLRSMSSMTEEEKKDLLVTIVGNKSSKYFQILRDGSIDSTDAKIQNLNEFNMHWINFNTDTVTLYLDWLNSHHFDYRGLIPKGLAIEVTKENNPYKD